MRMQDVLPLLAQAEKTEAIAAIQSIESAPLGKKGIVRIDLSCRFVLEIEIQGTQIRISAPDSTIVTDKQGLSSFSRFALETDEILSERACLPMIASTPKKMNIIVLPPPAPEDMDIPVWDAEKCEWYDAEWCDAEI